MANYAVDPLILKSYVPAGTELDYWNDTCYVSLVGFLFSNVRIKGIAVPFHRAFPEVNLRFYVRRMENGQWKRGVVFISEIVPKRAITYIANSIYKEHYHTMPMKHYSIYDEQALRVGYSWKKKGSWNRIEVTAAPEPVQLTSGSEAEFITEHFWGYAKGKNNSTVEYQVAHPRWELYNINMYQIGCDFSIVYGNEFSFLNECEPVSVHLAEGSPIQVFGKKVI